jgi:hypothetical protein
LHYQSAGLEARLPLWRRVTKNPCKTLGEILLTLFIGTECYRLNWRNSARNGTAEEIHREMGWMNRVFVEGIHVPRASETFSAAL